MRLTRTTVLIVGFGCFVAIAIVMVVVRSVRGASHAELSTVSLEEVDAPTADASSSTLSALPSSTVTTTRGQLQEAPPRTSALNLFFVGDVMLDRNVAARITAAKDDEYPFRKMMDDPNFTSADLRVMNLEGPVTDKRRPPVKSIDFMFDPRFIPVLRQVGFDAASQANNHNHDQGVIGADDSRRRLKEGGFIVFGDETRDDSVAMATTTVQGKRIAFVGFSTVTAPFNQATAAKTLEAARTQADYLIVFMHWGIEYHDQPSDDQIFVAHWLIDHGADVVIGAHPHWVESISSYKGKPILYSLGNFVFDQDFSVPTEQGLAVGVTLSDASTDISLHPADIIHSQPTFIQGDELNSRLHQLAAISDAGLSGQILAGQLSFSRL